MRGLLPRGLLTKIESSRLSRRCRLLAVKIVHTLVWAAFAGCVVAIPWFAFRDRLGVAGLLSAVVFGEVVVLALNHWSCPLTPIAARYTDDRRANFDIFLPEWLARHNKSIFGCLYIAGVLLLLYRWLA